MQLDPDARRESRGGDEGFGQATVVALRQVENEGRDRVCAVVVSVGITSRVSFVAHGPPAELEVLATTRITSEVDEREGNPNGQTSRSRRYPEAT